MEAGNPKPFNPEKLLHKYESIQKSQEKLREAGYDAASSPPRNPSGRSFAGSRNEIFSSLFVFQSISQQLR
jgi:hypothetical protein